LEVCLPRLLHRSLAGLLRLLHRSLVGLLSRIHHRRVTSLGFRPPS